MELMQFIRLKEKKRARDNEASRGLHLECRRGKWPPQKERGEPREKDMKFVCSKRKRRPRMTVRIVAVNRWP
jgi:hypothetical protein